MDRESPRGTMAGMNGKPFTRRLRHLFIGQAALLGVCLICFCMRWGYASLLAYATAIALGAFGVVGRSTMEIAFIAFALIWLLIAGCVLFAVLMTAAA
ncbi:MAG: hypothetical protein C0483_21420 [Pirellula sp.]|nr:hypothetical protein [Pirellula sp.]